MISKRTISVAVALTVTATLSTSAANAGRGVNWSSVPANAKAAGIAGPNVLSPQLGEHVVAQGSIKLENPDGDVGYFGYHTDGAFVPAPGAVQSPGHNVEASKTEPDKNTYLHLRGLHGADPTYDY